MSITTGYMSLEQLTGAPLTLKADVYAFGTLMWETCSLQVPFVKQGNDIYKIRSLVQAGTRLPALAPAVFDAHSKASQLHARFSLLIRRATNTHPKARPSMPEAEEMMCAAFDDSWTATSWELGRADLQSRLVALYKYALSVSLSPAQTRVQTAFLLSSSAGTSAALACDLQVCAWCSALGARARCSRADHRH